MNFKEALAHYRAGTATQEERCLVEEELEKNQLIAEYLDEQWEAPAQIQAPPAEEIKKVRRNLRKRSALIVVTSLVLAAAILLGVLFVGVPAVESLYWDPSVTSYGTPNSTDLELMLAAYAELFCPTVNIASVTQTKTGFATYDISIQYWDAYRGGESMYAGGTIEKGTLTLPEGLLRTCPVNIFDRATYPFYESHEDRQEDVRELLATLPEYITVVAAVSFPEDKSMEELIAFQNSLLNGQIGWTAIRTSPLDEQLLPLCGMDMLQSGSVRTQVNDYYPSLDSKEDRLEAQKLETHFKSLLKFSADQAAAGTGIPEQYYINRCYYTQVLEYVEQNGVYSYGCYISGTPRTFLALMESGAVTQVWPEDIFIGF